ncbi:hypothetical protein LPBF_04210 [Flavobacterium crassostreae]|uniref:Polysaccharide biosynthesis protein n=1 Tax=Flavobacterium crassostreae TaxID=1763534 RepID=A0A1B9E5J7_9FLAO|nr:hypothetical protein LPBF_04210 [Flavobacterium crassostreae]
MLNILVTHGKKHFSFALIVLGAGCFFLSNILFKIVFNEVEYGKYSIIMTYLSLIYILGLLGLEQIFLRYSFQKKTNIITTQKFQLQLIFWIILIIPFFGVYCFKNYFLDVYINIFLLYFASLAMVALLFIFNILRLNTNYVIAQFISNFWRFSLLIIAVIAFVYKKILFIYIINAILISTIFIFIVALIYCQKKIKFVFDQDVSKKDLLFTAFQFFISISTFSFLLFGDRFLVEYKFSVEEFGNYFYLTNFFLAPFSIFQNYIGFKQLISFKKQFSFRTLEQLNRKILILGCLLGLFLYGFSYIINFYKFLNFDFERYTLVIFLLIIMGIVRLYSASINSAFEAKTNIRSLQKANLIFIFIAILIMSATFFLDLLEQVVVCIILIWLMRCLIMKKILLKQFKDA